MFSWFDETKKCYRSFDQITSRWFLSNAGSVILLFHRQFKNQTWSLRNESFSRILFFSLDLTHPSSSLSSFKSKYIYIHLAMYRFVRVIHRMNPLLDIVLLIQIVFFIENWWAEIWSRIRHARLEFDEEIGE